MNMKKTIMIILTALITVPIFCQSYFPDSSAVWNVNTFDYNGHVSGELHYGLKGDSLLGTTLYHKLYLLNDTSLNSTSLKQYVGSFRQNAGKVWFIPKNSLRFLLFDFSKQVGDTIWHNVDFDGNTFSSVTSYISIIRSIYTDSNGRKRFSVETGEFTTNNGFISQRQYEWIQGIGCTMGLFGQLTYKTTCYCGTASYNLACFKQNDTIKYVDNPSCSTCFCVVSGIKEQNADVISVFPNPTHDLLYIKTDKPYKSINVELMDAKGTLIYSKPFLETPINVSDIINGIYFLRLVIDNEPVVKKVIIE